MFIQKTFLIISILFLSTHITSTLPQNDVAIIPIPFVHYEHLFTPNVELQKNDNGFHVLRLQHILNRLGYELPITGVYDETTTWAITDFQLQQDDLHATGIYNPETKVILDKYIKKNEEVIPGLGLPYSKEVSATNEDKNTLLNPYDQLALINKDFPLAADYVPNDLVTPNVRFPFTEDLSRKQMRQVAAEALEKLFAAADKEGLELFALSGYRSFERQDQIFTANATIHGEKNANQFSAKAGESEHQSGLTMDVTSPAVHFRLVTEFGETKEGKWLAENAADFGYIIRFPKGKEHITQYQYEPWHLRFVGEKAAKEMTENNLTLEEYLLVGE